MLLQRYRPREVASLQNLAQRRREDSTRDRLARLQAKQPCVLSLPILKTQTNDGEPNETDALGRDRREPRCLPPAGWATG